MFAISSCKKYLEVEPVSSFGTDYVFSNYTNAEKAILGVYSALGGDNGYGIRLSMYYPYDNDEMMGQGGTPYPDNERRDIAHFNVQASNTQLANPFNQLYRGIERANVCIYYIPQMDKYNNGSESEKRQLRMLHGEALTLRAQFYFELVRNWGDVPAQFEPSSQQIDLFIAKMNRDTIYNHILADLATASTMVPWRTEAAGITNERITQGAVRALRAKIALFRGGYSLRTSKKMERPSDYKEYYKIASDETKIIMGRNDHKLNSSYLAVFKDALGAHKQEPNGEILWEVGVAGGSSNFGDSKLGYYNGPRYNGTGNGALTILPTYFYSFDPQDTRRDVMCAPYDISANLNLVARPLQTMVDGKFRRDWTTQLTSSAQYFGTNWPMIRFSDVLLMHAEAENELNNGPTASAKSAFEQVRLRAFGGNASLIGVTPADYNGFFNAIVKERSLELGGEGIRKYDLIRWNMLAQRLGETKAELTAMAARNAPYNNLPATMYYQPDSKTIVWLNSLYSPSPATAPAGSANVAWVGSGITSTITRYYAIAFTPNKSELLPIPQASIDANPKLSQDYGY
ncbi:carbohydrate-binding protein SusD [Flavisolibacter tropicus]|uniref:Carbohydrate-binding protein SusD n=2 Tax=Flavisolibacter tropicus TaxID=1492898 RepID=A0A172TRM5_9BACT|nr:carbohydrate-binding protein SusD [Flavisolibacter tropicus]